MLERCLAVSLAQAGNARCATCSADRPAGSDRPNSAKNASPGDARNREIASKSSFGYARAGLTTVPDCDAMAGRWEYASTPNNSMHERIAGWKLPSASTTRQPKRSSTNCCPAFCGRPDVSVVFLPNVEKRPIPATRSGRIVRRSSKPIGSSGSRSRSFASAAARSAANAMNCVGSSPVPCRSQPVRSVSVSIASGALPSRSRGAVSEVTKRRIERPASIVIARAPKRIPQSTRQGCR